MDVHTSIIIDSASSPEAATRLVEAMLEAGYERGASVDGVETSYSVSWRVSDPYVSRIDPGMVSFGVTFTVEAPEDLEIGPPSSEYALALADAVLTCGYESGVQTDCAISWTELAEGDDLSTKVQQVLAEPLRLLRDGLVSYGIERLDEDLYNLGRAYPLIYVDPVREQIREPLVSALSCWHPEGDPDRAELIADIDEALTAAQPQTS